MTPRTSAVDTHSETVVTLATAASTITVNVTVAPTRKRARVEPQDVCARSGDTVKWLFENIPAGYEPMIQFTTTAATTSSATITTGPLKAICLEAESISGSVRDDVKGEFPYRVVLIPRPGFGSGILDLTVGDPPAICIGVDEPRDPQSSG